MEFVVNVALVNGQDCIVDSDGNVVFEDIFNISKIEREDDFYIFFEIGNGEYSYINSLGLFFDEYSYKEYDMVSVFHNLSFYKINKKGKYGLVVRSSGECILDCVFDEIELLHSKFSFNSVIKLKKNNKYSLFKTQCNIKENVEYDYIYTPIQPLDKFIVLKDSKYGFIDAKSLKEIIEPTFDTIEELCSLFKCDINKYTKDLYVTENELKLERIVDEKLSMSFIIDENKVLNGRWGGGNDLISDSVTGKLYLYELYCPVFDKYLPINLYGYFYNLFDCRQYDRVVYIIGSIYLVEKDGLYGLIDDEFHIILDIRYKDIEHVRLSAIASIPLFVISCDKGQFLFNVDTKMQTSVYDSLSWHSNTGCYKDFLVYEIRGKFGLISYEGRIITEAKFNLYKSFKMHPKGCAYLLENGSVSFSEIFNGERYSFYIKDEKFYGKIPIDLYDYCIQIGSSHNCYYVTNREGKFGLLNKYCEKINLPLFEQLIFAVNDNYNFLLSNRFKKVKRTPISKTYVIGVIEGKYNLYSVPFVGFYYDSEKHREEVKLIVDECDEMEIIINEKRLLFKTEYEYPYVLFKKNGNIGYVNENGDIISLDVFDKIDEIFVEKKTYYFIYKEGKVGLLDYKRVFLLPCIYEEIKNVGLSSAIVVENSIEKEVRYNRNFEVKKGIDIEDDGQHYSMYAGSYAQDEMGYSDEDIDTIFDGDPDAYWNID